MADRIQLLKEIDEISFTVNDLNLYLDTHPLDQEAINYFQQTMAKRKELLKNYANEFEPLLIDYVCPDTNNSSQAHTNYAGQKHFTWADGPLPWEGGIK